MLATKLSSALVAPSRVANILDWRKSMAGAVMGLDISRDRIGVCITEHPERQEISVPLESIPLHQDRSSRGHSKIQVSNDAVSELEAVVMQHRICAFVVNWPIHEGRTGEQCGKVLQVLDSVVDQSNRIVSRKRPFALWCSSAKVSFASSPPDKWGRSTDFSCPPEYFPRMMYSSKNIIRGESTATASVVSANVLDEWVRHHWEIDNRIGRAMVATKTSSKFLFSARSVDEYTSEAASFQAALL